MKDNVNEYFQQRATLFTKEAWDAMLLNSSTYNDSVHMKQVSNIAELKRVPHEHFFRFLIKRYQSQRHGSNRTDLSTVAIQDFTSALNALKMPIGVDMFDSQKLNFAFLDLQSVYGKLTTQDQTTVDNSFLSQFILKTRNMKNPVVDAIILRIKAHNKAFHRSSSSNDSTHISHPEHNDALPSAPSITNEQNSNLIPKFTTVTTIETLKTIQTAFHHIATHATNYLEALNEFGVTCQANTLVYDGSKSSRDNRNKTPNDRRGNKNANPHTKASEPSRKSGASEPQRTGTKRSSDKPLYSDQEQWLETMKTNNPLCRDYKKQCKGCGKDASKDKKDPLPHTQANCRNKQHRFFNSTNKPFHESPKGIEWIAKYGNIAICREFFSPKAPRGKVIDLSDPNVQLQLAHELGLEYMIIENQIVDRHLPNDICIPCLQPTKHVHSTQNVIIPVPWHRHPTKQLIISTHSSLPIFVSIPDCSKLGEKDAEMTEYTMVPSAIIDSGCLGRNYMM